MSLRVCIAGATGWAGSALARAVVGALDLELVAAVSRTYAGRMLGEALGDTSIRVPVYESVADALVHPADVLVEYTSPEVARSNILEALHRGVHVVVGTSGLTNDDFSEIDAEAQKHQCAVLACGNFALTAVLLQRFAEMAARLIPHWEIVDYASDQKRDAPSGTTRELADRLAHVRSAEHTIPIDQTVGAREARGASIHGSQIHSLRLPGFVISAEVIFGMPDQRLSIRHDSGDSAAPYVDGALLAIRRVSQLVGVHRGLDTVLDL
ncbi:MAG: 4-hydroxy-tetrahydrodipicolinate reductase [Longimicrobiales bacterium]